MHKIFKYPLQIGDWNTMSNKNSLDSDGCLNVLMPSGSEILDIQHQQGNLMLWAAVPTDNPNPMMFTRKIKVVGTGHEVDIHEGKYLKTIREAGDALVWHLFDIGEYNVTR